MKKWDLIFSKKINYRYELKDLEMICDIIKIMILINKFMIKKSLDLILYNTIKQDNE